MPPATSSPDADNIAGNAVAFNPLTGQNLEYDDELLDAHYIAGDGRVNENIGLTAVHSIFHSEHNRLVDQTKDVGPRRRNDLGLRQPVAADAGRRAADDASRDRRLVLERRAAVPGGTLRHRDAVPAPRVRGVRAHACSRTSTNSLRRTAYDTTINPAIVAEFAHTVYRFGHSMLTETVDRFDADFNSWSTDPARS